MGVLARGFIAAGAILAASVTWAAIRAREDASYAERPLPVLDPVEVAHRYGVGLPVATGNEKATPTNAPLIVATRAKVRFEDGSRAPVVVPLSDVEEMRPLGSALEGRSRLDRRAGDRPLARVVADGSIPMRQAKAVFATVVDAGY